MYYYMNKHYISQNLCVNKDKPELHCDGKCYLAKQIRESEKNESQAPVVFKYVELTFITPTPDALFPEKTPSEACAFLPPKRMISCKSVADIFHPPLSFA